MSWKRGLRVLSLLGWLTFGSGLATTLFAVPNVVLMTAGDRLHRFDSAVLTRSQGSGPSGFFHGVTVLDDEILVADHLNDQIQRFANEGLYLGSFAAIANPTFLESDSSGSIYTNPAAHGPQVATRLNSLGAVTRSFSHPSIVEMSGMDADVAGNVYISDRGFKLHKFDSAGTLINTISLGSIKPRDMSIDEVGKRLYLADEDDLGHGIKIFDIAGTTPSLLGSIATPETAVIDGIHFARETGHIFATDFGILSNANRGFEFSADGMLLNEFDPNTFFGDSDITTFYQPEQNVYLSLNVVPSVVSNPDAGGQWTLVAKTDSTHGIAGASINLARIDAAGIAYGEGLNPLTINGEPIVLPGIPTNIVYGQDTAAPGVAVGIGTPAFSSAPDPLGDATWDNATIIATGTYSAHVPQFALRGTNISDANLLDSSAPPFANILDANTTFVVRVALPGDFNDDGVVDAADYTVWRDTLGDTGADLAADDDGSLEVDEGDYQIWKSNFGRVIDDNYVAGMGSAAAAPEPAAGSSLLTAICLVAACVRRVTRRPQNGAASAVTR